MYYYSIFETYPILLIPLIRLNEPIIKKVLKEFLCCSKNKKRTKYKYIEDSLFAFLNSQLNVEYVYLILRGVVQIMQDEKIK